MNSARYQEDTTVRTRPPKKPSQVFLGDSLISGVLPKKKPAHSIQSFTNDRPCLHAMQASLPAECQVLFASTFYGAALQAAAFISRYESADNNILICSKGKQFLHGGACFTLQYDRTG